jgi:hypothetical protein
MIAVLTAIPAWIIAIVTLLIKRRLLALLINMGLC